MKKWKLIAYLAGYLILAVSLAATQPITGTDSIKDADNAPGRFSTIMNTAGMMDATIDLGGNYDLGSLKFYIYEVKETALATKQASVGANILIQVYADGVFLCLNKVFFVII